MHKQYADSFKKLYDNQVCIRCIFRIFKISDLNLYREKSNYSQILVEVGQELGDQDSLIKSYDFLEIIKKQDQLQDQNPIQPIQMSIPKVLRDQQVKNPFFQFQPRLNDCVVCLGILQKIDKKEFIYKLTEDIKKENYEFQNFKFNVKVPHGASARQIIINELKFEGHNIDLKICVKWILCSILSETLNKKSDANDDKFIVTLTFENLIDDVITFKKFQEIMHEIELQEWEEKLSKKLKTGNDEMKQHYKVQAKKKKDELANFLPSQNNIDRILKLPRNYYPQIEICKSITQIGLQIFNQNIFVMGNYIKYSRHISQTPWYLEGKKHLDTSIQDLISQHFLENFKPSEVKFHSAGREDTDVRMLNEGRPFALELVNPKRNEQNILQELTVAINKSIQVNVNNLHYSDVNCFKILKDQELNKVKMYGCIIRVSNEIIEQSLIDKINETKDLKIDQKTPIRVLHRRTLINREKVIHTMKLIKIQGTYYKFYLISSSGTYIKEFIHGDLERTTPNLGTLLGQSCDIFQLDVIRLFPQYDETVEMDFQQQAKET